MYRHTSSYEDMERNVRDAFFSIEKLEKSYVSDLNSGHNFLMSIRKGKGKGHWYGIRCQMIKVTTLLVINLLVTPMRVRCYGFLHSQWSRQAGLNFCISGTVVVRTESGRCASCARCALRQFQHIRRDIPSGRGIHDTSCCCHRGSRPCRWLSSRELVSS